MKADIGKIWGIVLGWGLMILFLAFFIQSRDYYGDNPIVRKRLAVKEAFQGAPAPAAPALEPMQTLAPGDPHLKDARTPFTLLNDWFSPMEAGAASAAGASPPGRQLDIPDTRYGDAIANLYKEVGIQPRGSFNSQTCYGSDFQTRLERTGNFRQLTNNYKRGSPDSCSAPLQDVAMGYYKIDPLPEAGCLSPKKWAMKSS
jgi:hypothetical protein